MFREIRQSREDPKVLAARAEEQYDKVLDNNVWSFCSTSEATRIFPTSIVTLIIYLFLNLFSVSVKDEDAKAYIGYRRCWFGFSLHFLFS